MSFVGKEELR